MTYRRALLGTTFLLLAGPALAGTQQPAYKPDLLPPNPAVGECYARVEIPAQYERTTERVVTREAHKRLHVQQPQLRSRTESIMVKEPSVRYVVRQPTYSTVTKHVMTRPGYDKLSVSHPHFKSVTETVQTGAPRLVWKRGNPAKLRAQGYIIHSTADAGVGGRGYSSTTQYGKTGGSRCGPMCEIWCLVEEPGDSVTVTRQVMTSPGQIQRTPVPPAYQAITQQVVTDPGGVHKVPVPAEYQSIEIQDIIHPGGQAYVEVPAEYGQVDGRRLVSESRYEWRRVVCKPGASSGIAHRSSGHTVYPSSSTSIHKSGHLVGQNQQQIHHRTTVQSSAPVTYRTTHTATTTHVPAVTHGTLAVRRPAYSTGYTSGYQGTYAHGATTSRLGKSGQPNRSYSGPAYTAPGASSDARTVIYESRRQR